jgi:hypothetical protein
LFGFPICPLLDWIIDFSVKKIQLSWVFGIGRGLKIQVFGFLKLDLVGCSIIHQIQNPEKSLLPNTV